MNRSCQKCRLSIATEKHHLFSDTESNRRKYKKLLDHPLNIRYLCYSCHHGHNGKVEHLSEKEFCEMLNIRPEGKTERFKLALGKR